MTLQVYAPTPLPVRTRRRDERRRLARHVVLSARLAELARISELLVSAQAIVGEGWVQHAWFRYRDSEDRVRLATVHDLGRMAGRPVVGACLVGAEVQAGGGPQAATSQLVARSLDLTWHTLQIRHLRVVTLSIRTGVPRAQALRALSDRAQIVEIRRLVTALLQATTRTARLESGRVREERLAL